MTKTAIIMLKLFLIVSIIACCWVASASSRIGMFLFSWKTSDALAIGLTAVCGFCALFRLYRLDTVFTVAVATASILVITFIDYLLRDSDLYKVASFYFLHLAVVTLAISLLGLLIREHHERNGFLLAVCWGLFISVTLVTGSSHVAHRSNAMIGVDYLVVVAASLAAAEGSRQYRRWRSRDSSRAGLL